jgi:hypothetical protein
MNPLAQENPILFDSLKAWWNALAPVRHAKRFRLPAFADDTLKVLYFWFILGAVAREHLSSGLRVAALWLLLFFAFAFVGGAVSRVARETITRQERLRLRVWQFVAALPALLLLLWTVLILTGSPYHPAYFNACVWLIYLGVGFAFGLVRWLQGFRSQLVQEVEIEAVSQTVAVPAHVTEPMNRTITEASGAEQAVQTVGRR